jgi:hypothetical protein
MIRVERDEEVRPGIWRYTVPRFGLEGQSRQPANPRDPNATRPDEQGYSARDGPRPTSAVR